MPKLLKTHQEIKEFVINTILTGNKDRIAEVIKRYASYLKEIKNPAPDLFEKAKEIFKT